MDGWQVVKLVAVQKVMGKVVVEMVWVVSVLVVAAAAACPDLLRFPQSAFLQSQDNVSKQVSGNLMPRKFREPLHERLPAGNDIAAVHIYVLPPL